MPGTLSPPPRVSDPDTRDARVAMRRIPGIPVACATHNFTYLVRGQCQPGVRPEREQHRNMIRDGLIMSHMKLVLLIL